MNCRLSTTSALVSRINSGEKMLRLVLGSDESNTPTQIGNAHIIDGTRIVEINGYVYICPPSKDGTQTWPSTSENGLEPFPPYLLIEFPAYQECSEILGFLCALSGLDEVLDVSYEYATIGYGRINATAFELRKSLHAMLFKPVEMLGLRKATSTALKAINFDCVWQIEERFAQMLFMLHPYEFAANVFPTKMEITKYPHSEVWEASVIDLNLYRVRFARTREIAQALVNNGLPLGIKFTAHQLMRLQQRNAYL